MSLPNTDDHILARFKADTRRAPRGRLKVFFGAVAGVGKTYTMLQEGHVRRAEGVDVVVGYVEPHGRVATESLLDGLEALPTIEVEHRGVALREFDLDAALLRKPELILVDELAHSNAPGTRHPKRWQDVEELLAAGIDVYTTVNVQHVESLNDVVAQITGVIVRETVPDSVIELADEIKLVDTSPEDLLRRLGEGKIYGLAQAERATQNFFRKGNLIALRELALRRIAERVDAEMENYRRDNAITDTWPTTVRMLVGVSSGEEGGRLVRAARRMASGLRASWIVAYVETPSELRRAPAEREQAIQTLRLAESLGAETVTLSGQNVEDELVSYAQTRNITKIVVGKTEAPRWRTALFSSVTERLLRRSGVVDIYVLSGDYGDTEPSASPLLTPTSAPSAYLWAVGQIVLCTAVALALAPYLAEANLIMLYLLGVVAVAIRAGRGPSVLAVIGSVLAFDFFLVPPQFTFAVSDTQYLLTFGVMLLVGLVVSSLTVQLRQQADSARGRERRTAALYTLSRELASIRDIGGLLQASVRQLAETFDSQITILLPIGGGRVQPWGQVADWSDQLPDPRVIYAPDTADQGVAQWVFEHREPAGIGTNTLPAAKALYLPLNAAQQTIGVLGVRPKESRELLDPDRRRLLDAFASQTAVAIERAQLAGQAEQSRVSAETERTRAALLSSVSHDLRTPLTVITGAAGALRDGWQTMDAATRVGLLDTAANEAERLNRLVTNLLEMTKLESGALTVRKEWQPLDEPVGAALTRLQASGQRVMVDIPADLPPVPIDGVLIEQAVFNLLDNALRYSQDPSPVDLRARRTGGAIEVSVLDRGQGIAPGDEGRIFDKFYRGAQTDRDGSGLGLAICRGIIAAHGGKIWAERRDGGGTAVRFVLPL